MTQREKVNILLVDDQPAKLLSLETILADLNENILKANSADEALKLLLAHDVAVVLVDVCMPNMDGFELAELIRGHPRYRRTAIIFISAVHLTDADRLRGYDLGAVDYIPVPIIPEVLRAKVAVFAELFRKTDQLRQLNRELEHRVAERTADLEASTERLRLAAEAADFGIYDFDPVQRVGHWSSRMRSIWGMPGTGPVSEAKMLAMVHTADQEALRTAMDRALDPDGNGEFELEFRINHPDGKTLWLFNKGRAFFEGTGLGRRAVRLIGTVVDATERRRADEARIMLAAIVESSQDAIISKTLDGIITSWNSGAEATFGYTSEEAIGKSIMLIIPPEYAEQEQEILRRLHAGERIKHFETVRLTKDGRRIDISAAISPLRDSRGRIVGASKVARDITERKKAEAILARDRETLERLVAERTAALNVTNERLRLSDRMATIGTLSVGLGHDMGNLLLPIRMRLDAIETCELSEAAREDVAAIRKASEYLQRLAGSLRMLALDPQSESAADSATDIAAWWRDAEGMIRNGVPRTVNLSAEIAPGLPLARIGKAALTQIVFNLAQNAGDALQGRKDGSITVVVRAAESGERLELSVIDNGPGMTDEARRRCMEPFFTTKTRALSTGLGLTLVSGLVKSVSGSLQIHTELGRGTSFVIELPASRRAAAGAADADARRGVAVVTLKDRRLQAHVQSVLSSLEFDVRLGEPADADIWVTEEDSDGGFEAACAFVAAGPVRRALVFGGPVDHENGGGTAVKVSDRRVVCLERAIKPSALRSRIHVALQAAGRESSGGKRA